MAIADRTVGMGFSSGAIMDRTGVDENANHTTFPAARLAGLDSMSSPWTYPTQVSAF